MKISWKRKKKPAERHQTHVQQLQAHCHQAWAYIKKHPGGKLFGIKSRPWVLLLGTPRSGKTALLSSSKSSLTSPHKVTLDSVKPTKLVDWWVSKEMVFIDPASEISMPKNTIDETRWKTLLNIIDRYRMTRPINQVMLVIDLPTLLKSPKDTIDQLSMQLQSIQALIKIIPVSLVISKCDTLQGFNEMFDDLNAEERQQVFGMTITKKDRQYSITQAVNHAFLDLADRLGARLINRLHREQSLEKRHKIYVFPSEFSAIEKPLEKLITSLPFSTTILLHGIYFTSMNDHRAYFINDMMKAVLNNAGEPLPVTSRYASERLLTFPIVAAIIFGFTLLWHAGYDQTIRIINNVQENLAATPSDVPSTMPWLSKLNILSNVLGTIHQNQMIRYQWVGLIQIHQMRKIADKEYKILLRTQFTPYVKSAVLTQIQMGMKGDKLALFDALKTYISLSQSEHYNKDLIMNWYRTYWKTKYPNDFSLQAKFQYHLFMLLESDQPLWQPDTELIKQAQTALQKLPLADLAFLELQGEYTSSNVSVFSNGYLEGVSLKNVTVPSFFSAVHFKEIFSQKIPNIGKTLAKGNWVLGTTTGKTITAKQQSDIAKKIRKMYLQYYTSVWAGTISDIRLKPATNYSDTLQRIDNVLNSKSDLTQLLKLVVGNASLNGSSTNKSLTAVKAYLDKKGHYASIQKGLAALKNEIQTIQKANYSDKASCQSALARFKTNDVGDPISLVFSEAAKNPEPIRSWLYTIALSSWNVMLKQTHSYLNNVWQTIVLPVYHNEIENRYPVFTSSRENISSKNFTDFFGPNGTVGAFFIYYLQAFVNTTQSYWTWKTLNGVGLNIPQKTLNTFIRASIIQQMFFTDNRNTPSFRFILAPVNLSGNSKKFIINVGGQIYNAYSHSSNTKTFYWPGPDASFVSTQFITTSGGNPTSTYNGPWAWFRTLDANTLQTTSDPRQFTLTIQSGSNFVRFRVITQHRVNPMVPGVLSKYRCPGKL